MKELCVEELESGGGGEGRSGTGGFSARTENFLPTQGQSASPASPLEKEEEKEGGKGGERGGGGGGEGGEGGGRERLDIQPKGLARSFAIGVLNATLS